MAEFDLFYQAAENLDALTDDGLFGNDAKRLKASRSSSSSAENLYDCLMNVFSDPRKMFGTKNTIGITLTLMGLFGRTIDSKGQEAVDILTAFLKGTEEHPELENLSSYNTYLVHHLERSKILESFGGRMDLTLYEKTKLANSVQQAYSKGVELVGKMYGTLLTLIQMINSVPYDLYKNSQLTIFDKTEKFLSLSNGEYDKLTTVIDRYIRNADSHSNMYFFAKNNTFILKDKRNKSITISWEKMILEIYPKIGWFVQGFICAAILVVLAFDDKERYKAATQYILEINSDPTIL